MTESNQFLIKERVGLMKMRTQKLLLLAAGIAIDTVYKESKN